MKNLVKVYKDADLQRTVKLFVNTPNEACEFINSKYKVTFLITWTVTLNEIQQRHAYKKAKEHFTMREFDSFQKANIQYSFEKDWQTKDPVFSCKIECSDYCYARKIFRKIKKIFFWFSKFKTGYNQFVPSFYIILFKLYIK